MDHVDPQPYPRLTEEQKDRLLPQVALYMGYTQHSYRNCR
jgi:hypothetical protein